MEQLGSVVLHNRLKTIDPEAAARIHPNDPQRIQRALEVFEVSGRPLSSFFGETQASAIPYHLIKLIVAPEERATLHKIIANRFLRMLANGLIEEVDTLFRRGDLNEKMPSIRAVGYRQVWSYLSGEYDYETMTEKGVIATRQLAKRQFTWLRKITDAHCYNTDATCIATADTQGTIAELLEWSRQKVNLMTKGLITLGYMESKARFDESGAQLSNMYRLLFDTPPVKNQRENFTPPVTEHAGMDYTNAPMNVPLINTASGENQPSATLPIEWQIVAGQEKVVMPDEKLNRMVDSANLIATGVGIKAKYYYAMAMAFMRTRDIVIPFDSCKAQRKPLKMMYESKVTETNLVDATRKLRDGGMTVVDLFSVVKTAIDLTNPASPLNKASYLETRE